MTTIAKYAIFGLIGVLLARAGYAPLENWQWWAWGASMMSAIYARDLAMCAYRQHYCEDICIDEIERLRGMMAEASGGSAGTEC